MKKAMVIGSLASLACAVPALAAKPTQPTHSTGTRNCTALNKGYYATGTLVSGSLTPGATAGRYDGTLTVDVSRANHKSATASQTYTLSDARVHFGEGVTSTTLVAGDRVKLHGKVTALPHGCSTTGFTSAITARTVTIKPAKASH